MREHFAIVAPNKRIFTTAKTWTEAVDKATDLSLRGDGLFSVRHLHELSLPFQRERQRVLETSMAYVELARQWPHGIATQKAKDKFIAAKRKLDVLVATHKDIKGDKWESRSPIKAFRSDIPAGGVQRQSSAN